MFHSFDKINLPASLHTSASSWMPMVTSKQLVVGFVFHATLLWNKRDFPQCFIVLIFWLSVLMSDFAKEMVSSIISSAIKGGILLYRIGWKNSCFLFSMLLNQLIALLVLFHRLTSVFFSISWLICPIVFLLIFPSSFFVGLIKQFVVKVIFVVF